MLEITRSHLHLSIGTGLAIGRLVDNEKHDTEAYVEQSGDTSVVAPYTALVPVLYINVRTLLRNIISAAEGISVDTLVNSKEELSELLISEIHYIDGILEDKKVVFYMFDYTELYKVFDRHVPTKPTVTEIKITLIETICKNVDYGGLNVNFLENTYKTQETCMIFTHEPLDLLNSQRYPSTTAIASYTGNVETRTMFNKHYTGTNVALLRLPYLGFLVYIIGVRGIVPKRRLKKKILGMAMENNWNGSMRWIKLKEVVSKDDELKEALNKYKEMFK